MLVTVVPASWWPLGTLTGASVMTSLMTMYQHDGLASYVQT